MILGIDEVGRGCWAGPLVVGAVVLPSSHAIQGLADSKRLSAQRRSQLAQEIYAKATAAETGWVSAEEVDTIGLADALRLATRRAVAHVRVPHSEIIIDGTVNFLSGTGKAPYVTTLKKADDLVQAVSAASIIAKVARDEYMQKVARSFPEYGFDTHVGYGTAKHRAALDQYGIMPEHWTSFAPVAAYCGAASNTNAAPDDSTSRVRGDAGERLVAQYLVQQGHEIVAQNWKTRWCEIDIISKQGGILYFTEVKYRQQATWGDGLAAITSKKQHQMAFAAELFLHCYAGFDDVKNATAVRLAAAGVSGSLDSLTVDIWLPLD